jgi:hypothetical protein
VADFSRFYRGFAGVVAVARLSLYGTTGFHPYDASRCD